MDSPNKKNGPAQGAEKECASGNRASRSVAILEFIRQIAPYLLPNLAAFALVYALALWGMFS